jgi:hypothetical protein
VLSKMLMLLPSTPLLPVSLRVSKIGLCLIVCGRWLVLWLQVLPQIGVDVGDVEVDPFECVAGHAVLEVVVDVVRVGKSKVGRSGR